MPSAIVSDLASKSGNSSSMKITVRSDIYANHGGIATLCHAAALLEMAGSGPVWIKSKFDLGAEFDDAVGRQLEEVRRRISVAEHPHEQDLTP